MASPECRQVKGIIPMGLLTVALAGQDADLDKPAGQPADTAPSAYQYRVTAMKHSRQTCRFPAPSYFFPEDPETARRSRGSKIILGKSDHSSWLATVAGWSPTRGSRFEMEMTMLALTFSLILGIATASGQVPDKPELSARLQELVRDLGADEFKKREAASKGLVEIGGPALEALRQAAKKSKDPEVQQRACIAVEQIEATIAMQEREKELASLRKELASLRKDLAQAQPAVDFKGLKPALDHSGQLTDDETWKADKTHRVTGLVTVPAEKTLTIEPGAIVLLAERADLVISRDATLIARSEKEATRIVFASINAAEGKAGPGGQIRILGGKVEFQNVHLSGTKGIEADEAAKCDLRSVSIERTTGTALALTRCAPMVEGLAVRGGDGDGIALVGCSGRFRKVRVLDTRLGIRFDKCKNKGSQSAGQWTDLAVLGAREEGLLLAGGSLPALEEVAVVDCQIGMRLVGQSYPRVRSIILAACRSDGIVVAEQSYPTLEKVDVSDVEGVGLRIQGNSYPTIGTLKAVGCKQGDQVVAPGSRIRQPE